MAVSLEKNEAATWKPHEKTIFRFVFVYFILQAVPLDWKYYKQLFTIDWLHLHFGDIFNITRYTPQFLHQERTLDFWGLNTFGDWLIVAIVATVGAFVWSWVEKNKGLKWSYDDLYYALRVILRYRLAIGVIAYGLIKIFPLQAPYPSLSNFNTNYGDLSAWKIFSLTLGVAPSFEVFLGTLEILGGLLLLYRRTVAIGAFLVIVFHGNVFLSNLAYEGGETVYSLYLVHIAIFLLLHDLWRIVRVFSLNKPTHPDRYQPLYVYEWHRKLRLSLKSVFIFFFVVLFGYKTYSAYRAGPYQYPQTPGLANASGLYNVREFKLNGEEIPYDKNDTVRWQNVVFETWSTLSVKTAAQINPWHANSEVIHRNDKDRLYELSGTVSRHYYHYHVDSVANILYLENKNPNYPLDQFAVRYERPDEHTIVFSGQTAAGDSLSVVLDRRDRKYLFEEVQKAGGRRGNGLIL